MTAERHSITLPGEPVTAAVSWDNVRAYLVANGWRNVVDAYWMHETLSAESVWIAGPSCDPSYAITIIARVHGCAPGVMLARIAGQAEPNCSPSDAASLAIDVGRVAYSEGAEAMRERCAASAIDSCARGYDDPDEIAARIRALPLVPEVKP